MSGYALCSWYKETCRSEGRVTGYVVAVTAEPDEATCEAFEIDRCIAKPISTQCIVELLNRYWSQRSPPSPEQAPLPAP